MFTPSELGPDSGPDREPPPRVASLCANRCSPCPCLALTHPQAREERSEMRLIFFDLWIAFAVSLSHIHFLDLAYVT